MKKRIEVIPYRVWIRDDGKRASIYGAAPWRSKEEKARWTMETRGYTWKDNHTNTTGLGRVPAKTLEDAQEIADKFNAACGW